MRRVLNTFRSVEKHTDDVIEFLDEEEQERLIEELRKENSQADWIFFVALHVLPSTLLIFYLYSGYASVRDYIYLIDEPYVTTPVPFSILLCMTSLSLSLYILHMGQPTIRFFWAYLVISLLPPLLMKPSSVQDWLIWGLPLLLVSVQTIALKWMRESEQQLGELEKAKYKLKGA
ncbi:hypothetical protein K7432_013373 [Basidiobolus ranarum]|uniref:Uncharacterized protein n=1 Tax=Basidiobolus ranarum TaxID=34480 RepID=A0ABR2WJB7_9FUNG